MANRRFYFFFIEIWPQEFYYRRRPAGHGGLRPVPGHLGGRPRLVRLHLPADGLGRPVPRRRARHRGRPQRAHEARPGALDRRQDRQARRQACDLAGDRGRHRRRLDLLLRRRADAAASTSSPARPRRSPTSPSPCSPPRPTRSAGCMREQVCTYMCPWPRIQAAMLDEHSLTVTYNDWRGEPRSRHAKKAAAAGASVGDCVDCNACVAVCPMGIDIRDGQQLECITCALCIDACDGVMDKLGRERGLISYATLSDYNANMALATAAAPRRSRRRWCATPQGKLTDKLAHFHCAQDLPAAHAGLFRRLVAGRRRARLCAAHPRPARGQRAARPQSALRARCRTARSATAITVKLLNMIPEPRTIIVTLQGLRGAEMNVVGIDQPADRSFAIKVEPDKLDDAQGLRPPAGRPGRRPRCSRSASSSKTSRASRRTATTPSSKPRR